MTEPVTGRFPDKRSWSDARLAVCRRCQLVMSDAEPTTEHGEFYHIAKTHQTRAKRCRNADGVFDVDNLEVVPFLRKARRRFLKRNGIRP